MSAQDIIPSEWWGQLNDYAQGQIDQRVNRWEMTPENTDFMSDEEGGLGFSLASDWLFILAAVQDFEEAAINLDPEGDNFPSGTFTAPANTVFSFISNASQAPLEAFEYHVEWKRENPSQDEGYDASYEFLLSALQAHPVTTFSLQTIVPAVDADQGAVTYQLDGGSDEDGPHLDMVEVWLNRANENEIVIKDADIVIVGEGNGFLSVENSDGTAVLLGGGDQAVGGSSANDIFVSFGGGEKELWGGAGNDTFAFAAHAHYVLGDFLQGNNQIAIAGAQNLDQLKSWISGVEQTDTGLTLHFGPSASITFVGLVESDLTADMVDYTFFG